MRKLLSLCELNNMVRQCISDTFQNRYWVRGELAEGRQAGNGHFYGELVERNSLGLVTARARINCWASTYRLVRADFLKQTGKELGAGLKVLMQVSVTFHEQYGYSLTVHDIDPSYTLGDAAQRRREIIEQLKADGLLNANKELTLPLIPLRIAIVSSATAAGYGDFTKQLLSNKHGINYVIRLFPALMQGTGVESSIIAALEKIAYDADNWDVVVIIRGGGATTDLSDFDSYPLAACVAQMPLPVITGIGHERDTTVLDSVAHHSLKTPTAVAAFLLDLAEAQISHLTDLQQRIAMAAQRNLLAQQRNLAEVKQRFAVAAQRHLASQQRILTAFLTRLPLACHTITDHHRNALTNYMTRLTTALRLRLQGQAHRIELSATRLKALDPKLTIARGYSITLCDGKLVRSPQHIRPGQQIRTILQNGEITSQILQCKKE